MHMSSYLLNETWKHFLNKKHASQSRKRYSGFSLPARVLLSPPPESPLKIGFCYFGVEKWDASNRLYIGSATLYTVGRAGRTLQLNTKKSLGKHLCECIS